MVKNNLESKADAVSVRTSTRNHESTLQVTVQSCYFKIQPTFKVKYNFWRKPFAYMSNKLNFHDLKEFKDIQKYDNSTICFNVVCLYDIQLQSGP